MIVKSHITEAVDYIVATGIHPVLKSRGFRKRGRTFHRRVNDLYHAVRVQASRHNEFDSGRFTINLGIAAPEIAAVRLGGREFKNPASQQNILLYARIGALESDALPVRLFGAPTIREETHALLLHRAGRVDEAETVLANLIVGKEHTQGLGRYVARIRELGARLELAI